MKRLVVCLLSVPILALATAAIAEDWKLAPGETKTYYDAEFSRVDQSTGLIVTRIAEGKANGPYKNWPASKGTPRPTGSSSSRTEATPGSTRVHRYSACRARKG